MPRDRRALLTRPTWRRSAQILLETFCLHVSGGADGDFLPALFALAQLPIGVWGLWNYVRLNRIKTLLLPQLGVLPAATPPEATQPEAKPERVLKLLPPRFTFLGGSFRGQATWLDGLAFIERAAGAPAATEHDQLWGALGAHGPQFFLCSVRATSPPPSPPPPLTCQACV